MDSSRDKKEDSPDKKLEAKQEDLLSSLTRLEAHKEKIPSSKYAKIKSLFPGGRNMELEKLRIGLINTIKVQVQNAQSFEEIGENIKDILVKNVAHTRYIEVHKKEGNFELDNATIDKRISKKPGGGLGKMHRMLAAKMPDILVEVAQETKMDIKMILCKVDLSKEVKKNLEEQVKQANAASLQLKK